MRCRWEAGFALTLCAHSMEGFPASEALWVAPRFVEASRDIRDWWAPATTKRRAFGTTDAVSRRRTSPTLCGRRIPPRARALSGPRASRCGCYCGEGADDALGTSWHAGSVRGRPPRLANELHRLMPTWGSLSIARTEHAELALATGARVAGRWCNRSQRLTAG